MGEKMMMDIDKFHFDKLMSMLMGMQLILVALL